MKKQIIYVFILSFFILCHNSYSQKEKKSDRSQQVTQLFKSQKALPIKLGFSCKSIKKETNDSTYIKTNISYKTEDETWDSFELELRVRGNNRLNNCYFPPIKMKIEKADSKGTLFEGNKKLKLVFPCLTNKDKNDYIVKEYMAYKLYEIISIYHYNTRMVEISFTDDKGKKTKTYDLKGILIEDDKKVAKRHGGNVVKNRFIHPMAQDPVTSVQNSFFQFMIGNTDFSTFVQHNEKILYVDKLFAPLPYDFDMSGLVNTSYSVVSVINNEPLPISSVRERMYRGFKRDPIIIQQVRNEFLDNKFKMFEIVDSLEPLFDDPKEFSQAKNYISTFFEIIANDYRYGQEITDRLRTK